MWCGCGTHYLGVWLVGGAFVPEGPSKKLAPMSTCAGMQAMCVHVPSIIIVTVSLLSPKVIQCVHFNLYYSTG